MKSLTLQLKSLHIKSTPPQLSASGIRSVTRNHIYLSLVHCLLQYSSVLYNTVPESHSYCIAGHRAVVPDISRPNICQKYLD